MKYSVEKVQTGLQRQDVKYILKGKVSGSVLFFDIERLGKYAELIHPDVGDIVAIDFPDENNREKYEITECFDKQLSQDGVNPLLHKYVWKCKARRYVNSYEEGSPEQNEADARLEERRQYDAEVQEEVAKAVSDYDLLDPENGTEVDAVYGGYERPSDDSPAYDKEDVRNAKHVRYDRLDFGTAIDIVRFGCGSRLVTDGYALVFVTAAGDPYEVAPYDGQDLKLGAVFESGLRWLKATDSRLVFVNIEGQSTVIADGDEIPPGKVEICLNSAHDVTLDPNAPMNQNGDNFVKFRGTRTLIWATEDALYARLDSGKKLCQLI